MTTTGARVREKTTRPRGTAHGNIVARARADDRGGGGAMGSAVERDDGSTARF